MQVDRWGTRPSSYGSFSNALDRLFEQAVGQQNGGQSSSTGFQSLPVNVWETDDGFHAAVLAPGLDEQSINVTVHEDTLAIEAETHFEAPAGAKMVWQEFGPAKYRRSLRLGRAVDPARVEALYQHGILLVTIPKAEHAKPRQIQVRVREAGAASQKG